MVWIGDVGVYDRRREESPVDVPPKPHGQAEQKLGGGSRIAIETKENSMEANTETYYVLFDEDKGAYVGTEFLGSSFREGGVPIRERISFFQDYTDLGVVHFKSPEGANNWLAPTGGYDRSRATLIRVTVEYTAEAV